MSHSPWYYAGFAVGVLGVGIPVMAFLYYRRKKYGRCKFDERQEILRGRAFRYGFFATLLYLMLYGMAADITGFSWGSEFDSSMIGFFVGFAAFAVNAIWNDAYFSFSEKPKGYIILFIALMILNFISGFRHLAEEGWGNNSGNINLVLSLLLLIILVTMAAKSIRDRNNRELEEE